jgi:hypothetical protein
MILRMTTTLRGVAPNCEDFRAGWDLWNGQAAPDLLAQVRRVWAVVRQACAETRRIRPY